MPKSNPLRFSLTATTYVRALITNHTVGTSNLKGRQLAIKGHISTNTRGDSYKQHYPGGSSSLGAVAFWYCRQSPVF